MPEPTQPGGESQSARHRRRASKSAVPTVLEDPAGLHRRLRIPAIAAPMLGVSGLELALAACRAGVVGAFPTANARTTDELDRWLTALDTAAAQAPDVGAPLAPYAPNLIIRQPRLPDDLACLAAHEVEMVITSVGSPAQVIGPLHDAGTAVFADVGTLRHARRAVDAGADGLVLLTAGAGGQTGWMNPFAFVRAVRGFFDGPLVLAGGMADGHALWAARVAGYDLAYMGTRFIAAHESLASDGYRRMLAESTLDDVVLTRAFTGLRTNMLAPSIRANGLDPNRLDEQISVAESAQIFGSAAPSGPKRYRDIWSAGHSVTGVGAPASAAHIADEVQAEYAAAQEETRKALS